VIFARKDFIITLEHVYLNVLTIIWEAKEAVKNVMSHAMNALIQARKGALTVMTVILGILINAIWRYVETE